MSNFSVKYRLYASNGVTLIYTLPLVQEDNSPQDPKDHVEIQGLRGIGSIIIPGSTLAWDLQLRFILQGDDYEDLITQMDSLESTIVMQTSYVLKIDRTSSTTKNYNVKRLTPFSWSTQDFRTNLVEGIITLRVNSWA